MLVFLPLVGERFCEEQRQYDEPYTGKVQGPIDDPSELVVSQSQVHGVPHEVGKPYDKGLRDDEDRSPNAALDLHRYPEHQEERAPGGDCDEPEGGRDIEHDESAFPSNSRGVLSTSC